MKPAHEWVGNGRGQLARLIGALDSIFSLLLVLKASEVIATPKVL